LDKFAMPQRLEELRRDGVAIAPTAEGFDLAVLDVTHPRFSLADDNAGYEALREELLRAERSNRRVPRFIMRLMLKAAARQSRLVKAMFGSDAEVLDGLSTYVMKLGPGNLLPPYHTRMDERFAAAPHATFMRLRTQQVADLLAGYLAHELTSSDRRSLHMINIAGGPAIDSLNTLILLTDRDPHLLDRPIVIHVLDRDRSGPTFGANALAAMQADSFSLRGFDIKFRHVAYDWNETGPLRRLLDEFRSAEAVIVCSSEGGLFEYGTDSAIVSNLEALNAGGVRCIAGSVTRSAEARRNLTGSERFKVIPRGLEGFAPLAARAGLKIVETRPGIFSDQVVMRPIWETSPVP
jgi:hypothetical protein